MADERPRFVFYDYQPSMVAAVIFIIGFGISLLVHLVQLSRRRTWFMIPFALGCFFEAIGFVGRAMSSAESPDFTKNPYIIQSTLLLLGPTLLAASIYMILGRLIVLLEAESYSMIRPKWLTKVFVLGDVLSFFVQGGGAGMLTQAKTEDNVRLGENIITGGLAIQILFFGFFIVVTLVFHMRMFKRPTKNYYHADIPWNRLLLVLYMSSILIMIRSVYRVAEYVMGSDSELKSKEIYLYCADALPMLLVVLIHNLYHPSQVLVAKGSDHESITSLDAFGPGH